MEEQSFGHLRLYALIDPVMLDLLTKFCVAILLSGVLGFERERKRQGAGLRTHILVCLGATLLVSAADLYMIHKTEEMSRVAAGIITGIGFLGGGTIVNYGRQPHGLTTAAMVWFVASLGVAVGLGYFMLSALATVFALIVAIGFERVEQRWMLQEKFIIRICLPDHTGSSIEDVERCICGLGSFSARILGSHWSSEKEHTEFTLDVLAHHARDLEVVTRGLRERFPQANDIRGHR